MKKTIFSGARPAASNFIVASQTDSREFTFVVGSVSALTASGSSNSRQNRFAPALFVSVRCLDGRAIATVSLVAEVSYTVDKTSWLAPYLAAVSLFRRIGRFRPFSGVFVMWMPQKPVDEETCLRVIYHDVEEKKTNNCFLRQSLTQLFPGRNGIEKHASDVAL
ncbi:hypothetical protein TNCV_2762031 [Trichonephila clavipes]|nr:hypothetical protein TNCV_2762031 [Trichonephila clavipes]